MKRNILTEVVDCPGSEVKVGEGKTPISVLGVSEIPSH